MKEITLEIGKLFDFFSEKKGVSFVNDQIVPMEGLEIPDETGEWRPLSGLIKKTGTIHKLTFDDGVVVEADADHLLSVEPENEATRLIKNWRHGDGTSYRSGEVVSNEIVGEGDVYGLRVESDTHLYETADEMVHHNTYECTRALEMNLNSDKYQMKYYKGNVGKSMTACCAFFYKYSNGYVIMLDDNDAMLMRSGVSQQVKLFFKAILDPDAVGQPIAVPSTVLKGASASLEALDVEAKPVAKKGGKLKQGGVLVEIDRNRLKEGQLLVHLDGKEALDTLIPLHEAIDLYESLYEVPEKQVKRLQERIREARDDDDDDDFISDDDKDWDEIAEENKRRKAHGSSDDEDAYDPNGEEMDPNSMPSSFIFNSSVIFISNLEKEDIDPAVWDRFTTAKIALNPMEYMDRLGKIYPHLGNVNDVVSSVPQAYVDWGKKCVLGVLEGIVEAWQTKTPLFGVTIQIPKRTLTFRLFTDLVEFFLRSARSYDRRAGGRGGDFSNKAYQEKILENVEMSLIKFAIKKIVFGE
jgi:hypothetical protein